MSNSVEDRVVGMKFDNKQFQKGAAETLSTLDKLKQAMGFKIKSPAADINAAAGKVNLNPITGAIEGVNKAFLGMATIAVTALANITNKAVDAGLQMASSLTFTPVKEGFLEYEALLTKQNTIMNATGKSAGEVKKVLNELNHFSDKTIYSFSNMTDSITKFVNAGVPLEQATKSIKGIANAAAFAGASTEDANGAMYAFSQAMSTGFIGLQDWNQIENANMGTQQFKKTLLETAVAAGELKKEGDQYVTSGGKYISTTKGWREGLQEQWATTEVLNKALAKYTDTSTKLGRQATQSATEVRTFSAFMDTLKESLGSGWAQVFGALVGNLTQATKMWTALSSAVGGSVGSFFSWLTVAIKTWRAMGGFEKTMQGFANILAPFKALFSTIGAAFREAFPDSASGAGSALYGISAGFELITRPLDFLASLIKLTLPLWTALFKGLALGVGALGALLGYLEPVTAEFGDFFDILSQASGGGIGSVIEELKKRFETLGPAVATAVAFLRQVGAVIREYVVAGVAALGPVLDDVAGSVQSAMDKIKGAIGNFSVSNLGLGGIFDMGDGATKAVEQNKQVQTALAGTETSADKAAEAFDWLKGAAQSAWNGIKSVLGTIKDWIADFFAGMGIQEGLALVNTGFFIAMYMSIKGLSDKLGGVFDSFAEVGDAASGVLNQVGDNLKTIQRDVKANIILKIAIALGILAAALYVLSTIDAKALAISLGAVTALLVILLKGLGGLKPAEEEMVKNAASMTIMSLAFIALATAILILAAALKILSTINTADLIKGTVTIGVLMAIMTRMGQAMAGTAGKQILLASVGLTIIAGALLLLAGALKLYASIDTGTLAEGTAKIVLILLALNIALKGLPKGPGLIAGATSLLIVAGALYILAGALKLISMIGGGDLVKAVTTTAVALAILVVAVNLATGTAAGAGSLLLISAALVVLGIALGIIGNLDITTIAIALGAIAAVFVVLGLAALALAPVVPIILALGIAIGILGVAMLAAGAGMMLFALALASLAVTGVAGTAALTATIIAVSELIPLIAQQIGLGMIAIAKVISESGPVLIEAFTTILLSLINAGIKVVPRFGKLVSVVIRTILRVLVSYYGDIVQAGVDLLVRLLNGIANAIPRIGGAVERIYNRMLSELSERLPRMADAGLKAMVKFINGLADAVDDNAEDLRDAGLNLAHEIVNGLTGGLLDYGIDKVRGAVDTLMDNIPGWAKKMLDINSPSKRMIPIGEAVGEGTALGIDKSSRVVESAVGDMSDSAVVAANDAMRRLSASLSVSDDFNPVITPVMDLTEIAKGASRIGTMVPARSVTVSTSTDSANDLYRRVSGAQAVAVDMNAGAWNGPIEFVQNNYSPKSMSAVRINRNTKSLLALAKEAVRVR